jgi:hypothetical protein
VLFLVIRTVLFYAESSVSNWIESEGIVKCGKFLSSNKGKSYYKQCFGNIDTTEVESCFQVVFDEASYDGRVLIQNNMNLKTTSLTL